MDAAGLLIKTMTHDWDNTAMFRRRGVKWMHFNLIPAYTIVTFLVRLLKALGTVKHDLKVPTFLFYIHNADIFITLLLNSKKRQNGTIKTTLILLPINKCIIWLQKTWNIVNNSYRLFWWMTYWMWQPSSPSTFIWKEELFLLDDSWFEHNFHSL